MQGQLLGSYVSFGDAIEATGPDVYLRPDGIDPAVTTEGNDLADWFDQSPNGHDFVDAGSPPELNLNAGQSNKRESHFDGSVSASKWQTTSTTLGRITQGTDEATIILRTGETDPTTTGNVAGKRAGASATSDWFITWEADNQFGINVGGTGYGSNLGNGANDNKLVVVIITTTTVEVWVDGSQVLTPQTLGSDGTDAATDAVSIVLGANDNSGSKIDTGEIDIFAFIPKAISTAERQAIETEFQIN